MGKDLKGKELGQGIYQRKDGKYCGRYTDRFGKRNYIYSEKITEVRKQLAVRIGENEKKTNTKMKKFTLDEWFDNWINIHKYNVIRESTRAQYILIFEKHISPKLGRYYIDEISMLQIKETLKEIEIKGNKYATLNRVRIMLQDMFDKAMLDDYLVKNPARGLHLRKPDIEHRTLSLEEQEIFFDCSNGTFYHNLFIVAVMTGLRIGELAALTWDDVDVVNGYVNVDKTLSYQKFEGDEGKTFHLGKPKTESSYRKVPINKQCKKALERQKSQSKIAYNRAKRICTRNQIEESEFENLIFVTRFGTPLNTQIVIDAIKRIVDEINLMRDEADQFEKFSPHCFRRTFATRCYEAGIEPRTIQAYLGHSTLEMTMQTYTSVFMEFAQSEINKLDGLLEPKEYDNEEDHKVIMFRHA